MSETPINESAPSENPPEVNEGEKDVIMAEIEDLANSEKKEKSEKSKFVIYLIIQ